MGTSHLNVVPGERVAFPLCLFEFLADVESQSISNNIIVQQQKLYHPRDLLATETSCTVSKRDYSRLLSLLFSSEAFLKTYLQANEPVIIHLQLTTNSFRPTESSPSLTLESSGIPNFFSTSFTCSSNRAVDSFTS